MDSAKKSSIGRALLTLALVSAAPGETPTAFVVQHAGSWPGDTANRAEVFIDRAQVVVSYILIRVPGHDLQQIAIERLHGGKAVGRPRRGTVRMHVIEINACTQD